MNRRPYISRREVEDLRGVDPHTVSLDRKVSLMPRALTVDIYHSPNGDAVIIGRTTHRVAAVDAMRHVAGFCAFNDGSVRDWQRHTPQFTAGKNFFASGAAGPCMTTLDEIDDVGRLTLETRLNGSVVQSASVGDMLFDIPALIEYCSTFARLDAGDMLVTGTPGGVGAGRTPPVWLKPGDRVDVDLGPVGCLSNRVTAT